MAFYEWYLLRHILSTAKKKRLQEKGKTAKQKIV